MEPQPQPEAAESGPAAGGWLRAIRDALAGKQLDYTRGNLSRAIVLLAIPMILEMVMESVFAVVDIYFVGLIGKEAVSAVGLTEAILIFIYAIAIGLAMSTTATVARRVGEKNLEAASLAASQAIALGIFVALLLGIPCMFFAEPLLRFMGASEAVVEIGSGYTTILLGTNVVIILLFLNNAIFRGAGDPAIAMRSLWLANGINIIMDPCLIFGLWIFPEMGVTGAAIATTIGRGSGVLYQFYALRRSESRVRLGRDALHFDPRVMWRLMRISFGSIAQFLVATASWSMLVRIIAPYGENALAGYTIGIRITIFAILPAWGLSNAAATLVGQNLGAGQPDRAEKSVWLTGIYNMIFLGVVAAVFITLSEEMLSIFTPDSEVQRIGSECLRVIGYGYVFYAWGMVMIQSFNGAGDTMTPTWINLACYWLFQIPLAWYLATQLDWRETGVFWAICISEGVYSLVCIMVFRRGRWKRREV
ncbi:MAG: MATE family efflux transporter [Planctomycetota bacterium]